MIHFYKTNLEHLHKIVYNVELHLDAGVVVDQVGLYLEEQEGFSYAQTQVHHRHHHCHLIHRLHGSMQLLYVREDRVWKNEVKWRVYGMCYAGASAISFMLYSTQPHVLVWA